MAWGWGWCWRGITGADIVVLDIVVVVLELWKMGKVEWRTDQGEIKEINNAPLGSARFDAFKFSHT